MQLRVISACFAVALTLAACGSDADPKSPDPQASERASAMLVKRSPLTGLTMKDGLPDNPAFVVKVENTRNGAPQYALNRADVVIEELVEGGLTRLAAVYYSQLPKKVGHIRSMRTTDIGIAAPINGHIVASGGSGGTYRKIRKAGITIHSESRGAAGFSSDNSKSRPYNRLINLRKLAKTVKSEPIGRNYFQWASDSDQANKSAKTATKANVRFSGSSRTSWAFKSGKWVRTNGHAANGQDFKADTLIVLYARVRDAGYRDPAGNPVPETIFKGTGKALILDGTNVREATWTKDKLSSQIRFSAKDGTTIEVSPGNVWIELIPQGAGSVSLN